MRQAVIHAFTKSISTVWIVMTPLCFICFVLGTQQISLLNEGQFTYISIVLFVRNYSMKRNIVQEGKGTGDGEIPSGTITPATQRASGVPSEKLQNIGEEPRISVSDLEKGLRNETKTETVDVKGEKDEIEEGYAKKTDSS